MTLPTWVAAGTFAPSAGDSVPGIPAGTQENDILLLIVKSRGDQPAAAPAGYAPVADSPQTLGASGNPRLTCFWKRASASESAPTVVDTGNHTFAIIHAFRGCITTGDPWDVTSGGAEDVADMSVEVPGDTTTVADCLVVVLVAHHADVAGAEFSAWTNADLANLAERSDTSSVIATGGGIGVATGEKAAAGAYGATSITQATAAQKAYMTIALRPPAVGGLSAVGISRVLVWDQRARVSATRTLVYNVLAKVGATRTLLWDARASVAFSRALVWNALSPVALTRTILWHVRSAVGAARTMLWNVRSRVGVARSLVWDVASALLSVAMARTLVWDIRHTVATSRVLRWDLRARVGVVRSLVWHQLERVNLTRILRWDVRARVTAISRTLAWNTQALVGVVRTIRWDVRARVGIARTVLWHIVTTASRNLVWALGTLQHRWSVGAPRHRWSVGEPQHEWSVGEPKE